MGDGRSARAGRTQALSQARALIMTGPEEPRARFAGHSTAQLIGAIAALRPRPGDVPGYGPGSRCPSQCAAPGSRRPHRRFDELEHTVAQRVAET